MVAILKSGGEPVTIGSFSGGFPARSSWGDAWTTRDAGIPLSQYSPSSADPMALWKSQPSLRKVVSFIARQVGSIPWHAYVRVNDTDRRRAQGSPAEQLLNRASRFRSGYNLWRDVVTDALLYDMFCVVYFAPTGGRPARLVRIPPKLIELKSNFLGEVEQVILHTPAGQENVDLTDAPMAISWGWSADGGAGVSPLFTLSQILEENKRNVQWRTQQWANSPKLSGVLTYEKGFKDDRKRDRFLQSWRTWRDSVNAGGTPILEDGMKYDQLESINKDLKDIEGRQLTDAEVASAFHIAPELVGARAGNFSNIGAFRQMLHGPTLGPLYSELIQAVNIGIVPHLDVTSDLYVEMDREAAINGSFLEQAQIISTATGGPWLLRSEARAKQNLPFIAGSDELVVPMNVTAGGQASPQDSGSQNLGPEAKAWPGASLQKKIDAAVRHTMKAAADEEAAAASKRDDMTAAIASVLAGQKDAIAAAGLQPDAFRSTWDPVMAEAVRPHLGAAALAAAAKVLAEHNPDEDGWSEAGMDGYLDKMAETSAGGINAGVVTAVEDADEDAELDDTFSALEGATALAWGASLAAQAGAFGGHDAAKASGLGSKTWVTQSSNPRTEHASLDGETVAIDDTFSNGARWPGDPVLDADESAGCMCAVEFSSD